MVCTATHQAGLSPLMLSHRISFGGIYPKHRLRGTRVMNNQTHLQTCDEYKYLFTFVLCFMLALYQRINIIM